MFPYIPIYVFSLYLHTCSVYTSTCVLSVPVYVFSYTYICVADVSHKMAHPHTQPCLKNEPRAKNVLLYQDRDGVDLNPVRRINPVRRMFS
jgi:hypothetical protein